MKDPVTPVSLLQKLRSQPDDAAWNRFARIYRPLLCAFFRKNGVQEADYEDLIQEVLLKCFRKVKDFVRQRDGSFRRWLLTVALNCMRDFFRDKNRQQAALEVLLQRAADPQSAVSQAWDKEHDLQAIRDTLEIIRPTVEEATWGVFDMFYMQERSAKEVAKELGISTNTVFLAKYRVVKKLREELRDIVEDF